MSVLLLDEATSALDESTQGRIQQNLENTRKRDGTTIITVAHRLSNFRFADKIVVLQKGRAVEQGTHKELLEKRGGVYAKYVAAQAAGALGKRAETSSDFASS